MLHCGNGGTGHCDSNEQSNSPEALVSTKIPLFKAGHAFAVVFKANSDELPCATTPHLGNFHGWSLSSRTFTQSVSTLRASRIPHCPVATWGCVRILLPTSLSCSDGAHVAYEGIHFVASVSRSNM